jgi:hypothetical protein
LPNLQASRMVMSKMHLFNVPSLQLQEKADHIQLIDLRIKNLTYSHWFS